MASSISRVRIQDLPADVWGQIVASLGPKALILARVSTSFRGALKELPCWSLLGQTLKAKGKPIDESQGLEKLIFTIQCTRGLPLARSLIAASPMEMVRCPNLRQIAATEEALFTLTHKSREIVQTAFNGPSKPFTYSPAATTPQSVIDRFAISSNWVVASLSQDWSQEPWTEIYIPEALSCWKMGNREVGATLRMQGNGHVTDMGVFENRLFVTRFMGPPFHENLGNGFDVYDLAAGAAVVQCRVRPRDEDALVPRSLSIQDTNLFFTRTSPIRGRVHEEQALMWDVRAPILSVRQFKFNFPEKDATCSSILFANGSLYSATSDGNISHGSAYLREWDTGSGRCVRAVKHKANEYFTSLSSFGECLYTGNCNGRIRIWDSQLNLMGKQPLSPLDIDERGRFSYGPVREQIQQICVTSARLSVLGYTFGTEFPNANYRVPFYEQNRVGHHQAVMPKPRAADEEKG